MTGTASCQLQPPTRGSPGARTVRRVCRGSVAVVLQPGHVGTWTVRRRRAERGRGRVQQRRGARPICCEAEAATTAAHGGPKRGRLQQRGKCEKAQRQHATVSSTAGPKMMEMDTAAQRQATRPMTPFGQRRRGRTGRHHSCQPFGRPGPASSGNADREPARRAAPSTSAPKRRPKAKGGASTKCVGAAGPDRVRGHHQESRKEREAWRRGGVS